MRSAIVPCSVKKVAVLDCSHCNVTRCAVNIYWALSHFIYFLVYLGRFNSIRVNSTKLTDWWSSDVETCSSLTSYDGIYWRKTTVQRGLWGFLLGVLFYFIYSPKFCIAQQEYKNKSLELYYLSVFMLLDPASSLLGKSQRSRWSVCLWTTLALNCCKICLLSSVPLEKTYCCHHKHPRCSEISRA